MVIVVELEEDIGIFGTGDSLDAHVISETSLIHDFLGAQFWELVNVLRSSLTIFDVNFAFRRGHRVWPYLEIFRCFSQNLQISVSLDVYGQLWTVGQEILFEVKDNIVKLVLKGFLIQKLAM